MKGWARTVWLWIGIFATPTACAYAQASAPDPPPAEATQEAPAPVVDPAKLGVSLERIRIQLATKPAAKSSGLKIQETIEVVGVAPKIELWNPATAKLATGPVPWGAPTHRDFIDLVTPKEFKSYPMDMNALVQWLMQHLADKTDKTAKGENKTAE
jgi:hypothetical protein